MNDVKGQDYASIVLYLSFGDSRRRFAWRLAVTGPSTISYVQ
jgi:hypothetical protein